MHAALMAARRRLTTSDTKRENPLLENNEKLMQTTGAGAATGICIWAIQKCELTT